MKYLKTFESFSINETMDMMTLPVDPIPGSLDVYSEVFKSIGNKINDIVNSLKRTSYQDVIKIKDFMISTFGTTIPELSKENVEKLNKVIGLDSINESSFKQSEDLSIKLCGRIKQLLGVNIHASAGIPLAIILGALSRSTIIGASVFLSGWALLWIFSKIMQAFGYGDDNTEIRDIGNYNPDNDSRIRSIKY
jgi:hypothetical protein